MWKQNLILFLLRHLGNRPKVEQQKITSVVIVVINNAK